MAWRMQGMMGLIERRLGRSSRLELDTTRLSVAMIGLAGASIASGPNGQLPLSTFMFALMLVWGLFVAVLPVLSWRLDNRISGLVLTIDFGIMALIIAFHQTLMLYVFPYALLLVIAMHRGLQLRLQLIVATGLAVLLAFFGMYTAPLALQPRPDLIDGLARVLFVLLCMLVLVTVRMSERYVHALRIWSDGLLIAGSHSQRIPLEFILAQIENRYPGTTVILIEDEDADLPSPVGKNGEKIGSLAPLKMPWREARPWLNAQHAFMFDTQRQHILHRGEVAHPRASRAPAPVIALLRALGAFGWGLSFPIRIGETSSRVFVIGTERPSAPALQEGIAVRRAVEAVYERFHFQGAWRERAFIEARSALGRDLHDTVLQTMASLRLQIATMLSLPTLAKDSELHKGMLHLQHTIAEEQRTFRETLDEGHRAATEPVDLNAILSNRMIALSEQWDIACAFVPSADSLIVSANTAVEVEFIIREVVSNSVQHGRAKSLTVRISLVDGMLLLAIIDNAVGSRKLDRNGTSGQIRSKSLARRLTSLGASAYADDTIRGSLLSIRIPLSRT